jgi:hypothetical protein
MECACCLLLLVCCAAECCRQQRLLLQVWQLEGLATGCWCAWKLAGICMVVLEAYAGVQLACEVNAVVQPA